MASEMASVLRRLKLDHLIDKFISEKITPDLNDFRELGVHNRNEIMKLRIECSKYGSNQPSRNVRNGCGGPVFKILRSVLECYLE